MSFSVPPAGIVESAREKKTAYGGVQTNDFESGSEIAESHAKRSIIRIAAVSFGVAALVAVLTCGVMYGSTKRALESPNVIRAVVDYASESSLPIAPWIKPKPALCNPGLVLNFCLRLNKQGPGYFGSKVTSPKAVLTLSILSDYFMASKASITDYLKSIGAENVGLGGDFTVTCQGLCEKTMASFKADELPGMVDVGCYYKSLAERPICDVDAALHVLANIELPKARQRGNLAHQFLDEGTHVTSEAFSEWQMWNTRDSQGNDADMLQDSFSEENLTVLDHLLSQTDVAKYQALAHPDVPFDQLQMEAARLFRVFPASKNVSLDISTDASSEATKRRLFDNSCASSNDGTCDVPFSCTDGTDCADCGDCNGRLPDDSCHYSKDDECDEARYCMVGTDCSDCGTCGLGGEELAEKIRSIKPNDQCSTALDGTCDPKCEEGTDCTDCNTCRKGGAHFAPAQYQDLALQAGTKVQALLAAVLMGVASGEGREIMMTFVGRDGDVLRNEIKRMLIGLSGMLDNVNYVFPGTKCNADSYGYVSSSQDEAASQERRQYTMNLCKAFMAGNPLEQYMTIMQTGIHANPMLAETATLDGKEVFSVEMVEQLATKCREGGGDECTRSVRNAQTVLHVINGFVKLAM